MTVYFIIGIVFVIVIFLLLGKLSPYESDFRWEVTESSGAPQVIEKIVEVEKIIEVPVEIIKEIYVEKEVQNTVWRNIGLELYQEQDLDRFIEKLNFMIGKKVTIVTDSSYVLGANFKDHKDYCGNLKSYEILEGRYPDQPIVKFIIDIPVLPTTTVNLNWVYDKYRFDSDFSSCELVADYLKNRSLKNELLLVEI
jgi:hypothetical protein